jgi:hypothetical protein
MMIPANKAPGARGGQHAGKDLRETAFALLIGMEATKLPADVSSKVYDAETAMFFTNGHFDPKDVAAVEHALIESGQLDTMPNTSKYLTEEFLK